MVLVANADILPFSPTVAIIASLASLTVTLYFSWKQLRRSKSDLEMKIQTYLDEKLNSLFGIFLSNPEALQTIYDDSPISIAQLTLAHKIISFSSEIYQMRQRKLLGDNQWESWFKMMKNVFRWKMVKEQWKSSPVPTWFDASFREFVDKELIGQ